MVCQFHEFSDLIFGGFFDQKPLWQSALFFAMCDVETRRGGKALLFAIAVSSLGTTDGPMMHVKQTKPALSKDEGNLKSASNQN